MEDLDEPVTNGAAVTAFVFGLLAAVVGLLPYIGIFAPLIAIFAILFGIAGWRRSKTPYKPGRVLSVAALTLGLIGGLLGLLQVSPWGWQVGSYPSTEPPLRELTPMTCEQFELPDEWNITYEAVRRPIWVIDYEGPNGRLEYAALRYRSPSCRRDPQIGPLLD